MWMRNVIFTKNAKLHLEEIPQTIENTIKA